MKEYKVMTSRFTTLLAATAFALTGAAPKASAQDGEIQALRRQIEAQSHKIDALAALVERLNAKLDGNRGEAPAVAPTEIEAPIARPVAARTHIVVKGESLDKIAKLHNVQIAELLKLNKISDPKKLQIGQQLLLPAISDKKE